MERKKVREIRLSVVLWWWWCVVQIKTNLEAKKMSLSESGVRTVEASVTRDSSRRAWICALAPIFVTP